MSIVQTPSHPGLELAALLRTRGMPQSEFAKRLGVSKKHVNGICNGRALFSPSFAVKMERVLGEPSAGYWLQRLGEYRLAQIRPAAPSI